MPEPADSKLKHADRDDAAVVVRRLRDAGHIAYFAGGCVRDQLLGLEPKDYDVATDATPDRVRQLFSNTQAVGAAFGVILVRQRQSIIEVATFRTDLKYTDGRRPEGVVFTNAEEDAKRRDFTINGLFFDPIENKVIDYVGGQEDLRDKVLRAIGEPNHRFEEDHLRLLRAIRFASRFELQIEAATAVAIQSHAQQLKRISPERIADELRLMLPAPTRTTAWPLLWEFGLIDVIFRTLSTGAQTPLDVQRSILMTFSPQEPLSFGEAIAAAVLCFRWQRGSGSDIREFLGRAAAIVAANAMRQSLKISNDEAEEMRAILELTGPLIADQPPTLAAKKRFLGQRAYPSALELMEAIANVGEHGDRIWPIWEELKQLEASDCTPPPLITGDDLTAAGLQPGPVFKRVLDAVYDAQLEDRIHSKEQALELALRLGRG